MPKGIFYFKRQVEIFLQIYLDCYLYRFDLNWLNVLISEKINFNRSSLLIDFFYQFPLDQRKAPVLESIVISKLEIATNRIKTIKIDYSEKEKAVDHSKVHILVTSLPYHVFINQSFPKYLHFFIPKNTKIEKAFDRCYNLNEKISKFFTLISSQIVWFNFNQKILNKIFPFRKYVYPFYTYNIESLESSNSMWLSPQYTLFVQRLLERLGFIDFTENKRLLTNLLKREDIGWPKNIILLQLLKLSFWNGAGKLKEILSIASEIRSQNDKKKS